PVAGGPIVLRKAAITMPTVLAIGSSTGGPQALFTLPGALSPAIKLPILITQHMPATLTTLPPQHLSRLPNRPAAEGVDGETIQPGRIYLAPGGFHMKVEAQGSNKIIRLTEEPPENFCRPAVDPMLRSMSAVYGAGILCMILTGMGSDGAK